MGARTDAICYRVWQHAHGGTVRAASLGFDDRARQCATTFRLRVQLRIRTDAIMDVVFSGMAASHCLPVPPALDELTARQSYT